MPTSRRRFLKHAAVGAVAAGLTATLDDNLIARELFGSRMSGLDRSAFESQLNCKFTISDGNAEAHTRLIEVVDLGSNTRSRKAGEAFSLTFRGSGANRLSQGTYSVRNQKLGAITFLVVPIFSKDKTAQYYEVIVNRLHG